MTPRAYLNQAYRLEQRIKLDREEIESLRALAASIGCPGLEERYNPNKGCDAGFTKTLEKVWKYEEKVKQELDLLLQLKTEIQKVISAVPMLDERLVLTYRYLKNYSWSRIGDELAVDERTVRRWHDRALSHIILPDNHVII